MTQPFKTCPHCQQNAVLTMAACRRCGYVFPNAPVAKNQVVFNIQGRPLTPTDHYFAQRPKLVVFIIIAFCISFAFMLYEMAVSQQAATQQAGRSMQQFRDIQSQAERLRR